MKFLFKRRNENYPDWSSQNLFLLSHTIIIWGLPWIIYQSSVFHFCFVRLWRRPSEKNSKYVKLELPSRELRNLGGTRHGQLSNFSTQWHANEPHHYELLKKKNMLLWSVYRTNIQGSTLPISYIFHHKKPRDSIFYHYNMDYLVVFQWME